MVNGFRCTKHELANTAVPAALIEVAYHDNIEDTKWIINNIEEIGTALAKGMLKYFNIQFQGESLNLEKEIKLLQEFGILNSPDYWRENAVKGKVVNGEYAAYLIQKVVALLLKGANG